MAKSFISEIGDRLGGTGVLNTDGEHVKVISAEYYKRTDDGVVTNLSIQEALDAIAANRSLPTENVEEQRSLSKGSTGNTPYARGEAEFGPGETYGNQGGTRQSILLDNNSYTVASGLSGSPTDRLDIYLADSVFPMAVLVMELDPSTDYGSISDIKVFNGEKELRRLRPYSIDSDNRKYDDVSGLFANSAAVEVHILGDRFSILAEPRTVQVQSR